MPFPEPQPSRRAVVVAGMASAAGLALTGCTSEGDLPDLPGLHQSQEPDPDAALVRRVRRDETDAEALVAATRHAHPDLRVRLEGTLQGHQAHVALLRPQGKERARVRDSSVPPNAARALSEVVTAERDLARRHASSALEAQSGPLARAIASMSAAAAQQASVLAATAVDGAKG